VSSSIEDLRQANRTLRTTLTRFRSLGISAAVVEFSSLRNQMRHTGDCLQHVSPNAAPDVEWEKEVSEYRSNLMQLQQVLPSVYGHLQVEKQRLETALDHLQAVHAWTRARTASL